jgi:hypothetical protein
MIYAIIMKVFIKVKNVKEIHNFIAFFLLIKNISLNMYIRKILLRGIIMNHNNANFSSLKVSACNIPKMAVRIAPGIFWHHLYQTTKCIEYRGGNSPTIKAFDRDDCWVIVAINEKANIVLVYGKYSDNPILPVVPYNLIPLAAVYVINGIKQITSDKIYDLRPFLEIVNNTDNSSQQVNVYKNGEYIATSPNLNFMDGIGIAITATDDKQNNQTKIVMNADASNVQGTESGNTVSAGTSFSLIPRVGSLLSWSRFNHKHGTPPDPRVIHEETYDHSLLHLHPNDPTHNEKLALVGTAGLPSDINKYVTVNDYRTIPNAFTFTALYNLDAFKVITTNHTYCSNLDLTTVDNLLGMTLDSALQDNPITVRLCSIIFNPNWNFDTSIAVFLSTNGDISQNITNGPLIPIGVPINATTLLFRPLIDSLNVLSVTTTIAPTTTTTTEEVMGIQWMSIIEPMYVIPQGAVDWVPEQSWYCHWDGVKWINDYDTTMLNEFTGAPFYLSALAYTISCSKLRIRYDFQGRQGHLKLTGISGEVFVDMPYTSESEYIVDPSWHIKNLTMYSVTSFTDIGIIYEIECLDYVANEAPVVTYTSIISPTYISSDSTNRAHPVWTVDKWVSNDPTYMSGDEFRFIFNTGTFSGTFIRFDGIFECLTSNYRDNFPVYLTAENLDTYGSVTYSEATKTLALNPTWQIKYIQIGVPYNHNSGTLTELSIGGLVQN